MKNIKAKQVFQIILAVFITAVLLRTFVIDNFIVKGDSMAPTVLAGDLVFVNKLSYLFGKEPGRGDIIVLKPRNQPIKIVKRVIGLPAEKIEITEGKIYIKENQEQEEMAVFEPYLNLPATPAIGLISIKLDPKEYFVLGDNRQLSIDSRELGPIDKWSIKGRVFFVLRPKTLSFKIF